MEQEIIQLLNPIINSNSVWKNHALKFLGDFYHSNGPATKSRSILSTLSEINETSHQKSTGKIG